MPSRTSRLSSMSTIEIMPEKYRLASLRGPTVFGGLMYIDRFPFRLNRAGHGHAACEKLHRLQPEQQCQVQWRTQRQKGKKLLRKRARVQRICVFTVFVIR